MRCVAASSRNPFRFGLHVEALETRLPISEGVGSFLAVTALAAASELARPIALAPPPLAQVPRAADVHSTIGAGTSLLSVPLIGTSRNAQETSTGHDSAPQSPRFDAAPRGDDARLFAPLVLSPFEHQPVPQETHLATLGLRGGMTDASMRQGSPGALAVAEALFATVHRPEHDFLVPVATPSTAQRDRGIDLQTLVALSLPVSQPNPSLRTGLATAPSASIADAYARLPLNFEANRGQTDARVRFLSRGPGYTLFLTATEAVMALPNQADAASPTGVVRIQFVGANPSAAVAGLEELPGKSN